MLFVEKKKKKIVCVIINRRFEPVVVLLDRLMRADKALNGARPRRHISCVKSSGSRLYFSHVSRDLVSSSDLRLQIIFNVVASICPYIISFDIIFIFLQFLLDN